MGKSIRLAQLTNILDIYANNNHRVQKLVVASSMSIYSEGNINATSME
jgi:hypothetical protein